MKKEEYDKLIQERARNRWYKLSLVLSESECATRVNKVAMAADFASVDAMRSYFLTWGDKMVGRYGELPYRVLNSSFYEKYMEMK